MLKVLKIILAVVVIALAEYGLITKNYDLMPYTMSILGAMMLVTGIIEIKKERRTIGYISIIIAAFVFFVSTRFLLG